MRILTEAHSYSTFANAEKAIKAEMAKHGVSFGYIIAAQEDGRFSAVVIDSTQAGINFLHATNYRIALAG